MQRQRGHPLLRHGIEAGFELGIPGIALCVAPARAIRVQRDVCPIRIFERDRRALELGVVRLVRDEPFIPDVAGEGAPVFAHKPLASLRGHQPVIPVVLRLAIAQDLAGVIRAVAHRQRDARGDLRFIQCRGDVRRACAPVVTHQRMRSKAERGREFDKILSQRDELPAAKGIVAHKPGRAIAAQPRHVRAITRAMERWQHAGPRCGRRRASRESGPRGNHPTGPATS